MCHGQALMQPVALSSAAIPAHGTALIRLEGPDPAHAFPALPVTRLSRGSSLLWLLLYPPATMREEVSLLCPGLAGGKGWDGEASSQACSPPMQLT